MTPLRVIAELTTPPVVDRALYLDAVLLAGVGERLGRDEPSGWVDEAVVYAQPLPLARVESPYGWWWAASAVTPFGPEQQIHVNRVPLVEEAARWTSARSLNQASGPDKRMRVPHFVRPEMLRLVWTCVGDPAEVADLLSRIPAVGRLRGHGHGWVRRWSIEPGGPPTEAYGTDLHLRHLPAELPASAGRVMRRQIPLRPPYHRRREAVPCWQVQA